MKSPAYRRVERACVGLYGLVAVGSLLGYLWLANVPTSVPATSEPKPAGAGTFAVVGLFWLCALVAAAMAVALLAVNAVRVHRGEGADRAVAALALSVLVALTAAGVATFYGPVPQLSLALGVVALVVAPAGLVVATLYGAVRGRIPGTA